MNYFETNLYSVVKTSSQHILQMKAAYAKRITDVEHNLRNQAGVSRFKAYDPSTKEKTDQVFPRTKELTEEQWSRLLELLCSIHYFCCHYYRNNDIYFDQDLIDTLFGDETEGFAFKVEDKRTFFGMAALCSVFVSKNAVNSFLAYLGSIPGFEIGPNNKPNLAKFQEKLSSFSPDKYHLKGVNRIECYTNIPFILREVQRLYLQIEKNVSGPTRAGVAPSFLDIAKAIPGREKAHSRFTDFRFLRNLAFHGFWPDETFEANGRQRKFELKMIPYVIQEWADDRADFPGDYYAVHAIRTNIINLLIPYRSSPLKKSIQLLDQKAFEKDKAIKRAQEVKQFALDLLSKYIILDKDSVEYVSEAAKKLNGFRFEYNHSEFRDNKARVVCFKNLYLYHIVSSKNIILNGVDTTRNERYVFDTRPALDIQSTFNDVPFRSLNFIEKPTIHPLVTLREAYLK